MKIDNPKITIVTVTYNAEQYLEQTIKSVISQDYPNIEYIIIDGASTDGTIDIIRRYEQYITYWISEPDKGIYDAMNKAIDIATGEWINFMNAGDSFYGNRAISTISEHIDDAIDLIAGDVYFIKEESVQYQKSLGIGNAFDGMFCFHQALFSKTNIMKKFKFDTSFTIAGDYDFVLKCYINNFTFKFINAPIANFLDGGISATNLVKARIEDLFIQSKFLGNIQDIFNKYSYSSLQTLKNSNNRLFVKLLYDFYLQVEDIKTSYKDCKFVLYGYGTIGRLILNELYEQIEVIVDKNLSSYNTNKPHSNIIEDLTKIDYDYIIISALGYEDEIKDKLFALGVTNDKILTFSL